MPGTGSKSRRDGDHYRIAFDRPNTWSQKYNLIWDKLLGLDIFPAEVARNEVAYYKKMIQRYGVPLDSRTRLTKTDWCLWSATLADDRRRFRGDRLRRSIDYLNETTARLPFVDSYVTDNRKERRHAGPPGDRRRVHQDARRPCDLEEMVEPRPHQTGNICPAAAPPRITDVIPTSAAPAGHLAVHFRAASRRLAESLTLMIASGRKGPAASAPGELPER